MAEVKQVTLKRFNGTDDDTLHPTTDWEQVENKPSTFTATAHTLNSHTDVNASPTDGQALVWDGTNSLWVAGEGGGGAASVTISATEPTSPEEGDLWWDSTDGNLYIYYNDGTSSQWVEASAGMGGAVDKADLQNLYIYGKASVAITKGQAVQFAGAEGDHILIKPAVQSEINANPDYMIGIADSDLSIGVFGYVIVNGRLTLDTSTYTAGNILYFDSAGSTAGALTTTEPIGGTAILQMAAVSVSGVGNGEFVVRTMLLSREIQEVIGLQTALDGKAASSHTHAISDVTGLQTALDGKATPADITTAIDDLVDLAPGSLDTLNELAAALGDDANFAGTVTTSLAGKSNVGHTHTKSEITDFAHTHDDRYYTETEVNSLLAGKQAAGTYNTIIGTDSDINTSGSTIIDNIFVTDGVITSMGTRTLTLGDLGYTGATNANNYTHPTYAGDDINLDTGALSGATVISDLDFNITSDTQGHITDANATYSTRNLTAANIGAAPASHTHDDRYYTESESNSLFHSKGYSVFSGDAVNRASLATRTESGFYEHDTVSTGDGWPVNGSWYHAISATHSNDGNYYAMQFAGDFFNSNNIFYRSVNNSGTTAWNRMWHSGNLTNLNQLSNGPGYVTSSGVTSVATGGGLTGGTITGTGTISHADTSAQGSVNNSSGTVIQDITLDTYGHITGLGSVNLDGRYYTEGEADSRFVNATGDTMSGSLTMGNNYIYGDLTTTKLRVGSTAEFATVRSMEIRADDDDSSNTEYLKLMAGQNTLQVTSTSGGGTDNSKLTYNGNKVWNSGNDGSGSGLDADLLDGQHASAFATASHSHSNYLPIGGPGWSPSNGDTIEYSSGAGWFTTPRFDWTEIKSGSTTITSGSTGTAVTVSQNLGTTDVIAFELNTTSVSSYSSQVIIMKLEDAANAVNGAMYNAYASTSLIRIGSINVRRELAANQIRFSSAAYFVNGSSVETSDTVYVGKIWKLTGITGV